MPKYVNPGAAWSMVAIIALVILADFAWFYYCGVESTFSLTLRHAAERWGLLMPAACFVAGLLAGHFWF